MAHFLGSASRERSRLEREQRARLYYEQQVDERKKKLLQQKLKEDRRRAAVEEKRKQRIKEEKVSFDIHTIGGVEREHNTEVCYSES